MTVEPRPWWTDAVVYQIYPRSFADSDGDGIGDLRGIIDHLDHLEHLGVDVVWLSPIYPSPQDDNGYDIRDYQAIEPTFGTLEDFDELVAGLHGRRIRLVMDLVVNHTSDEHPWFVESRSSPDAPRRDWYWWRPARPGTVAGEPGAEPTNWGSFFSGSAWAFDESGEYYLHLFSPRMPDLNWENPEVRSAVQDTMRWWVDRGVDGFRMDVINLISKDPTLPDGPVGAGPWASPGSATFNGPRVHEYLAEMHREVFGERRSAYLTVGETPGTSVEDARLYTDADRGEVDMVFQFEHVDIDSGPGGKWDLVPLDLVALKANLARWQEGLADVGWNSLYWNNHDQPRAVSRFGDDDPAWRELSAKTLGTVLHLHRGTPYVYQGEELGMTNAPFATIDDFRDIESTNHYAQSVAAGQSPVDVLVALQARSRDQARTPMQWTPGTHAGFTDGVPWLAVNPNHVEINAAAQAGDPGSVFAHYRALIELRHTQPVVAVGDFALLLADHPTVWAVRRRLAGEQVVMLANLGRDDVELNLRSREVLGDLTGAEVLLATHDDARPPAAGRPVALRGWESVVLKLRT
jgi:oligo-1,6-glucosidase